jgi:Kef-type K+ transport system membrane component KefB
VLIILTAILAAAKLGGFVAERFGMPAVLGEIIGGIMPGNLLLGPASALTLAAIVGKQVCGFGVLEKSPDRISIGAGMIPRGEVGLIFASIGKQLKVVDDSTCSAVVVMIIVTTLITPPILNQTFARRQKKAAIH